jgi:hypothetical protein
MMFDFSKSSVKHIALKKLKYHLVNIFCCTRKQIENESECEIALFPYVRLSRTHLYIGILLHVCVIFYTSATTNVF